MHLTSFYLFGWWFSTFCGLVCMWIDKNILFVGLVVWVFQVIINIKVSIVGEVSHEAWVIFQIVF